MIVLLILAGVSISLVVGNNGVLTYAIKAKEDTDISKEKEGVRFAALAALIESYDNKKISKINLERALQKQFDNSLNYIIIDNAGESFTLKFTNTDRMYYIDNAGNVIEDDDILKIGTKEELIQFKNEVNKGKTFEGNCIFLTNNINVNGEWEPIGVLENTNGNSIGSEENKPFKGIFNGNGYEIDGIQIDTSSPGQGLFGLVNGGVILNLGVGENSSISNTAHSTAGVVAYLYNFGKVINCYNKGNVTAIRPGGITGQALGTTNIENCYNIGIITKTEGNTYLDYSHYAIVAVVENITDIELKSLTSILGNGFKNDINEINNGYSILNWQ